MSRQLKTQAFCLKFLVALYENFFITILDLEKFFSLAIFDFNKGLISSFYQVCAAVKATLLRTMCHCINSSGHCIINQ